MSLVKLSKLEANEKAINIASRLNEKLGGTWTVKVWFNSWWCYSISCGTINVSEYGTIEEPKYSALISSEMNNTGTGAGIWSLPTMEKWKAPMFDTPEKAVIKAMCRHLDVVEKLVKVAKRNEEFLDKIDWSKRDMFDQE